LRNPKRGGHLVDPVVVAQAFVFEPGAHLGPALVAKASAKFCRLPIVGYDYSALAGRDLLVGIERKSRRVSKSSQLAAPEFGSQSLTRVVDNFQPVLLGDPKNLIPIRRMPEDVDRHNRFSARTDSLFEIYRI
jgi:hypothetical protein